MVCQDPSLDNYSGHFLFDIVDIAELWGEKLLFNIQSGKLGSKLLFTMAEYKHRDD